MKPIKNFEEFIKKGVVKKQSPDKSRAEFLINEAKNSLEVLNEKVEKIGISDKTANSVIKDCHDILMEIVRSKMFLRGYNASGFKAHEAEVSFLRVLGFDEKDVQFADQIRFFRNGMLYYGTMLDKEYAEKVFVFLKKNIKKLRDMG